MKKLILPVIASVIAVGGAFASKKAFSGTITFRNASNACVTSSQTGCTQASGIKCTVQVTVNGVPQTRDAFLPIGELSGAVTLPCNNVAYRP